MTERTGTDFWPDYKDSPKVLSNLEGFSRLIERVVECGGETLTEILRRSRSKELAEHYLSVLMCYRHAMELLAAIAALIRQASAEPCAILLRALFESVLYIEYILEADTENRGMAFLVYDAHDRIRRYDRLDPKSERGKQFARLVRREQGPSADTLLKKLRRVDYETMRAQQQLLLTSPNYQVAEQEYQRVCKSTKNNNPNWYRLFGGSQAMPGLAEHLKHGRLYEMLYRQWSGAVHGTDVIEGKITLADKKKAIDQINSPKNAQQFTLQAVIFGRRLHKNIIRKLIPDRMPAYARWYACAIQRDFKKLSGRDMISVSSGKPK